MVRKSAAFYYGLENGRSGKLSRESDGLETYSREKDVAPNLDSNFGPKHHFKILKMVPIDSF